MAKNKITQWLLNNKIGLIIGFIFGTFIAPFLACHSLVSAPFGTLQRSLLIGPLDFIANFIPNVQTYDVPFYKWILTFGFNGMCYAILGGIIHSKIAKNKGRKQ